MLGTCVMATPLLCHGPEWQMVALTAQGWLSAVLAVAWGALVWEQASGYGWMDGFKSFSSNSRACVRVCKGESNWFEVNVWLRQGCVMSLWLLKPLDMEPDFVPIL